MIQFDNETNFRTYFETLATANANIDAFRYGDDKAKAVSNKSDMDSGITFWLEYYPPIQGSGEMDGLVGVLQAEWVIMKPGSDKTLSKTEQETLKAQLSGICMEVFKAIKTDFLSGTIYGNEPQFNRLKFGTSEPIHIGSTEFIGCAAELPFHIPLDL